jgi:hypothetical protein
VLKCSSTQCRAGSQVEVGNVRNYTARRVAGGRGQSVRGRGCVGSSERGSGRADDGLAPAASDLVSAMTATQFGQHGATYQQIAAQAAAVHEQLVATLRSGAGAYELTEAANAATAG